MSDEYYAARESELRALLTEVSNQVSTRGAAEVEEFIRHAEYGVALIWLADLLVESHAVISPATRERFVECASVMNIVDELPAGLSTRHSRPSE